MTTDTPTPGPRQTVDRVCHPTLGEGIAVYHNGPAYFQADSGEVVMMRSIDLGGCGTFGGTEFRSYNVAHGLDGSRFRFMRRYSNWTPRLAFDTEYFAHPPSVLAGSLPPVRTVESPELAVSDHRGLLVEL